MHCHSVQTTSQSNTASTASPGALRRGKSFTSLPVIDIAPLVRYYSNSSSKLATDKSAERRLLQQTCAQLDSACRTCGFFYVINHGVDEALLQSVRDRSREFFNLQEEEKMQYKIGKKTNYRGYQNLGDNVTRYVKDDGSDGFVRDWHEALDFYREVDDPSSMRTASPLHGRNPEIQSPTHYSEVLKSYSTAMLNLSETIMRGLAVGLGLNDEEQFIKEGVADETYWVMRVINYPPLVTFGDEEDKTLRASDTGELCRSIGLSVGEHSDYGFLTLVNQDAHATALQVKNADGLWVDAPPLQGTLVCNIGNMLENLTAGLYKSTMHRVIHTSREKSRISIPFFFEPNFDARIQPLEELLEDGDPQAYEPVIYGNHLNNKILGNFELQE